jgi:hypothetical protein
MPPPPAGLRGQLVEHPPIETVTFDLGTTPPPAEFRLFTGLFGPAIANANSGQIIFGVCFQVTQPNCSLVGYSQWCCNSGQDTNPLNFALWHLTGLVAGTVVPGSVVTGGALTQGQFNDTFLPAPVALTAGTTYVAQMGLTNGFPVSTGFWSSTGVGYRGIVNGPLEGFSDQGASNPGPFSQNQCNFAAGTNDPTVGIGPNGNAGFNEWLDVLISTG